MKLYEAIAQNARLLADTSGQWADAAQDRAKRISDMLPSGSGFDCGTTLMTADQRCIVFKTSFHHMDDNGMYDGWTEHQVTVRASFIGLDIAVSGRNKNDIKDYITDVFSSMLDDEFDWLAKP